MRYLILLYGDEHGVGELSPADRRAIVDKHVRFAQDLRERGAYVQGEALAPAEETQTLRPGADGRMLVTDGPFAETREQVGGFYLIDCADPDEARGWAGRVPRSPGLVVEIRPVREV